MNEYYKGKRLRLLYTPARSMRSTAAAVQDEASTETHKEIQEIEVEIVHSFQPFTISVVCTVRVLTRLSPEADLPSTFLLKLYDRRYAQNPRTHYDKGRPYSAEKELAYQAFLIDPNRFPPEKIMQAMSVVNPGDEGAFETSIHRACELDYDMEVKAYALMEGLQGVYIPRFHATLQYTSTIPPEGLSQETAATFVYAIPGIAVQYIPSVTLESFLSQAMASDPIRPQYIAKVCESALEVVDRVGDTSVLNQDFRLENILVVKSDITSTTNLTSAPVAPRTIGVDFANVRFRHVDETDEQWRRAREFYEEEQAIGTVIEHRLKKWIKERELKIAPGDIWKYHPTQRWGRELSEEELEALEEDCTWGLYRAVVP